jgi:hypothetical protein
MTMTEDRIKRFADYSDEELAGLLRELERGDDDRLARLISELRAEIGRRRLAGGSSGDGSTLGA